MISAKLQIMNLEIVRPYHFLFIECAGNFDAQQMATILEVALNLRRFVEEITALCCKTS
jgi:hypothetical protein